MIGFEDIGRAAYDGAKRHQDGQDANAPWPEPDLSVLSPHREPPPRFPLESFGPFWGEWLAAAAEGAGAPVDFTAMPLLSVAGGLLGNVRRAQVWRGRDWIESPLIWSASVGEPSTNKTPALAQVMKLVRVIERRENLDFPTRKRKHATMVEEAKLHFATWQAEVKAATKSGYAGPLQPEKAVSPDSPALLRIEIGDITQEKVGRLSINNPRGLILFRDELAGWTGQHDKYGGSADRPFWLETWNGGQYVVDRVKDGDVPIIVPRLSVSILGGVQPDRMVSAMLAGDDDGLSARFLYAWPEHDGGFEKPALTADHASAADALERLRRLPLGQDVDGNPEFLAVPLSVAAERLIPGWRHRVKCWGGESHGLLKSWVGKLTGYTVRVALALEYLWWCGDRPGEAEPQEVSERAMLAAIAFIESYASPMARRCFGDAALPQAERDAVALAGWIRRNRPESVNARELRRGRAIPSGGAERYHAALAELEEAGWVRPAPAASGPGRPRKDWHVNPAVRVLQ